MAHGLNAMLKRGSDGKTGIGSRRIFAPQFKLQVLDSYRNDADCKGNQRATARKYGIHRRQIQKWLQVENNLRNSVIKSSKTGELIVNPEARKCGLEVALRSADYEHRQRDDSQRLIKQEGGELLERESPLAIADKRVPDIPLQHSPVPQVPVLMPVPVAYATPPHHHRHHEWHSPPPPENNTASTERCDLPPAFPAYLSASPPCPLPVVTSFKCEYTTTAEMCAAAVVPLDFSRRSVSPRGANTTCPSPPASLTNNNTTCPLPLAPLTSNTTCPSSPLTPLTITCLSPLSHTPVAHALIAAGGNDGDCCATPMDLSLKKTYATSTPPPPPPEVEPQIWDLSTKCLKRKHDDSTDVTSSVDLNHSNDQPKPVKLFKPYLDNVIEDTSCEPIETKPAIISSSSSIDSDSNEHYVYNNNNNNNDYKMDYSFYRDENYQYFNDYYPNGGGGLHFNVHYDENRASNSIFFAGNNSNSNAIKQRQSYSLDFKLSAIECYYSDAVCRGNQRAVASKFKIHRRQVQKWLKQEDELRQRNDATKPILPMHIVR